MTKQQLKEIVQLSTTLNITLEGVDNSVVASLPAFLQDTLSEISQAVFKLNEQVIAIEEKEVDRTLVSTFERALTVLTLEEKNEAISILPHYFAAAITEWKKGQ